jgi:hypothetical protein
MLRSPASIATSPNRERQAISAGPLGNTEFGRKWDHAELDEISAALRPGWRSPGRARPDLTGARHLSPGVDAAKLWVEITRMCPTRSGRAAAALPNCRAPGPAVSVLPTIRWPDRAA